jgi:hypothetical protein
LVVAPLLTVTPVLPEAAVTVTGTAALGEELSATPNVSVLPWCTVKLDGSTSRDSPEPHEPPPGLVLVDGLALGEEDVGLLDGLLDGLDEVGPVDGLAELGPVDGPPPPQVWPFRVNEVGTEVEPVSEPLNPNEVVPPELIVPLYDALVTVTALPLWVSLPFHRLVTCSLPLKFQPTFQELIAEPELVMVTLTLKPTFQLLTIW